MPEHAYGAQRRGWIGRLAWTREVCMIDVQAEVLTRAAERGLLAGFEW